MMNEGAPQAASSTAEEVAARLRADALARLRYGWGDAYRIGWDPARRWWAQRRDGEGSELTADSNGALWDALFEDYVRKPVPRDTGAGQAAPS
jgi:hypothetical protein